MRGVIAKRIGGSLEATHLQHVADSIEREQRPATHPCPDVDLRVART
jgi:hypothetical protein